MKTRLLNFIFHVAASLHTQVKKYICQYLLHLGIVAYYVFAAFLVVACYWIETVVCYIYRSAIAMTRICCRVNIAQL